MGGVGRSGLVVVLAAATSLAGCDITGGGSRNKTKGKTGTQGQSSTEGGGGGDDTEPAWLHTVMIIDDGFDADHSVFKDKITARYTIRCDGDAGETDFSGSFEDIKAGVIANYKKNDTSCSVDTGISFSPDPKFKEIAEKRDAWNKGITAKSGVPFSESQIETITSILAGDYHGTNTAGLIAYQNKAIKLVMVQLDLRNPGDSPLGLAGSCPTQDNIDMWVRLHKEADVRRAYIEAPVDSVNQQLGDIASEHKVTLLNLSLGQSPRSVAEKEFEDAGCGKLSLAAKFELEGELQAERTKYRAQQDSGDLSVLTVQAAGNDSVRIDTTKDALDCSDRAHGLILVGALDYDGKRAAFSNYGNCVDYYLLGQEVVLAAPDDWLTVGDGTSFSTPLLVRYISRKFDAATTPEAMIKGLDALAGSDGHLPAAAFPAEIAFADKKDPISSYALTSARRWSLKPRRATPPSIYVGRGYIDFGFRLQP